MKNKFVEKFNIHLKTLIERGKIMTGRKEAWKQYMLSIHNKERRFENAYQAISRMILEKPVIKVSDCGEIKLDYEAFRQGKKHPEQMYNEINSFVLFVKSGADGGATKEMAFVFIGDVGTGKSFLCNYLCDIYRKFLKRPENKKYTFKFTGLEQIKLYENIPFIESETYENPMTLAMNLFEDENRNKKYLCENFGFSDKEIEKLYENYRFLGADTAYTLNDIRQFCDGNIDKIIEFVEIIPISIEESFGTMTARYPAQEKLTSSATDLRGNKEITRLLRLKDINHPHKYNLREGVLARVAGGGILFDDELFKKKKDLIQVYLSVFQERLIDLGGFKWPLDVLIIATSNNDEFQRFKSEGTESPIVNRCMTCYVAHNTNYKMQQKLTSYVIGEKPRTTIRGENLHIDPNLNYALSVAFTLTRLSHSGRLTPIEELKLAAGEVAGEKSVNILKEIIKNLSKNPDPTKRFGQKGLGQRDLMVALQLINEAFETDEGRCMFAFDAFDATERVILDRIEDANERNKYFDDVKEAKILYRKKVETDLYNAYRDDPDAIKKDVMGFIYMIMGLMAEDLGSDKVWKYRDSQGNPKVIKLDERYVNSIEEILGHKSREEKKAFRNMICKLYGQKISVNPNYDFMDNVGLVAAITEVRINSDILGAGSLIGALANQVNEENQKLRSRIMDTMINQLGYCQTCAIKTIEYCIAKKDQS